MEKSYLYKYLKFDDGSLNILEPGTLKFVDPSTFNDPFDCKPYFDEVAANKLSKHRPDLVKKIADQQGLSPAKRLLKKSKFDTCFRDYVISGRHWKSVTSQVGISCLSRNALNILMWSHYADQHKGFVVEFEWGSISDYLIPFEVHYSNERPKVNPCTNFSDGKYETYRDLLLTKSAAWSYEAEERLIDWRRPAGIYKYNRNEILKTVILGVRMPPDHKDKIKKIVESVNSLQGTAIKVFEAVESKICFSLEVPNHPRELRAIDRPDRKPREL